ncbi:MAG TPA: cysteine desulfurase-like protein [Mycobacteriales bacterium]|nr:cysteine desulfurase-like protein [Mycobacteriales bacterium]
MGYDLEVLRAQFPALALDTVHLDGPGGTQVPRRVQSAVAEALVLGMSNRHGSFAASRRADDYVEQARMALADLVGAADPAGVVLGPSMTSVTFTLARALAKTWGPGDEIVVSELDHDANIRPWLLAARDAGAQVRWARVDPATGELPAAQYDALVNERTVLVAVTAASNALGTRPQVAAIAARAHAASGRALVYVDGVHATPHGPTDVRALGADFYACSAYKFCGPHLGAVSADPDLLASLRPDKLLPSSDAVPDRFETGTAQAEALAGLTAAVEHFACLGDGVDRRARLRDGMARVEAYETSLLQRLLDGLSAMPSLAVLGAQARRSAVLGAPARRTPTVALVADDASPQELAAHLGRHDIAAWSGDYYAVELFRALGRPEGALRLGLSHYTTSAEVDRVLAVLAARPRR